MLNEFVGRWVRLHYARQARAGSTFQSARNLRKQGFPLALALAVLVGRV